MVISGIFAKTIRYPNLAEISPEPLRLLYEVWLNASSSRDQTVLQSDLDISSLRLVLPNMALVDLQPVPLQARYILVGPKLVKLLGQDPTQKLIDEVYPPDIAEEIYTAIQNVCRERQAQFFAREYRVLTKRFGYRRLMLPIFNRAEDTHPKRLIIGIYPNSRRLTDARQWKRAVKEAAEMQSRDVDAQHVAWEEQLETNPSGHSQIDPPGEVWELD